MPRHHLPLQYFDRSLPLQPICPPHRAPQRDFDHPPLFPRRLLRLDLLRWNGLRHPRACRRRRGPLYGRGQLLQPPLQRRADQAQVEGEDHQRFVLRAYGDAPQLPPPLPHPLGKPLARIFARHPRPPAGPDDPGDLFERDPRQFEGQRPPLREEAQGVARLDDPPRTEGDQERDPRRPPLHRRGDSAFRRRGAPRAWRRLGSPRDPPDREKARDRLQNPTPPPL